VSGSQLEVCTVETHASVYLQGDHDSEIAIVIEDSDMIETTMGGNKYMASRMAATWRRALMKGG
jgi:hypothetical protein